MMVSDSNGSNLSENRPTYTNDLSSYSNASKNVFPIVTSDPNCSLNFRETNDEKKKHS